MANVRISDLTALSGEIPPGAVFEIEAGGASYKLSDAQLAEFIRDTIGAALVAGANVSITRDDAGNTIAVSSTASGGGSGGAQRHPGYRSGFWHRFIATTPSALAQPAGALLLYPMIVEETVTLDTAGIVGGGTAVAGAQLHAGIYAHDATTRRPGLLLGGTALASPLDASMGSGVSRTAALVRADGAGNPTATPGIVLQPGLYWRAVFNSAAPTLLSVATNDAQATYMIGLDSATNPTSVAGSAPSINITALGGSAVSFAAGLPPDLGNSPTYGTGAGAALVVFKVA